MKIAIIGAGASGLVAARRCKSAHLPFDVFEQTGRVAGIWNYSEYTGTDENGVFVATPMYKGLRTNLPKELMVFEGFPHDETHSDASYVTQEEILKYLNEYCREFQLLQHIQFFKTLVKAEPQQDDTWCLQIQDSKTKATQILHYDAVIVCNGHFSKTFTPKIPGIETFPVQNVEHSFTYRTPDKYKGKRVLILGAGPSGCDISQQIANVALKVFLSSGVDSFTPISDGVVRKCYVKRVEGNKIVFIDESEEIVDAILFCTGYLYDFPFLDEKSGIYTMDNSVFSLYKHIVNIEHPSMAFIGLNSKFTTFPVFEMQVRYYLAYLSGNFKLPSKIEMKDWLEHDLKMKEKLGVPLKSYHVLAKKQKEYLDDLADSAGIYRTAPVISKLHLRVMQKRDLNDCFKIIDDWNYVQIR